MDTYSFPRIQHNLHPVAWLKDYVGCKRGRPRYAALDTIKALQDLNHRVPYLGNSKPLTNVSARPCIERHETNQLACPIS